MVLARSTPPARSPADGPALSPVEGPALSLVEGPCLDGKFLRIDGGRFLVKGVSYGTFAPGPGRAQFPAPARVAGDFAAMAAAEFNTVRTYTVPPMAVLDAAAAHGLRVMVGLPWPQHVAFLDDPRLVRQIRRDAAAEVRRLAAHPAALLFAIGNEIPPGVVRWHGPRRVERFLRELCDEVKAAAPESLLTYVNFPPTDYLELECVDVCAFNVYLHREADLRAYLSRLQHIAGPRPLLLAEAGADSRREGLDGQARLDAMQVRAALAEGACGAVAFAWTDEWWRGGRAVDDWAFGLVDAERRPKPALAAAARAFADGPFAAEERVRWPKVSVIVCARDAEDTIDDCLTSLAALTYPNVELLVINDGSRDATSAIARRHPSVRVIDVPPGGLSAARNMGLAEASGEIVAYTDADVRVDPDWLTYLVPPLLDQDVVGVGGPNVVPADDPWLAQCVARAPGGPTHVLLDDRIAEHVPGCNMAFRRDALLAIGGFNPVYVRAGDDVDVCWRLQAAGHRIGFAGAALVWHHHRASVRAFWRQQVGYGEAESWLDAHHPEKSAGGAPLWRGRIYSPLPFVRALSSRTVNTGVWGTAAFPSVYATGIHLLQVLPHSPVWLALSSALMLIGALLPDASGAASPLLAVGLGGWLTTLVRCVQFAWRSDVARLSRIGRLSLAQSRLVYRAVIAWLHVIQPLARTGGRLRGMWSMPHLAPAEGVAERADL
ncbi:MAG: glycosyltransferase [Acidobacteria bacterium]|nr:glycosyltransferase [Acidobacteriota bacterium]